MPLPFGVKVSVTSCCAPSESKTVIDAVSKLSTSLLTTGLAFSDGEVAHARIEIFGFDSLRGGAEGVGLAGEVGAAAPFGLVEGDIGTDLADQFVDSVVEVSAGEVGIDESADAAVKHRLGAGIGDQYLRFSWGS